jgi:hypothetical protein
MKKRTGDGMTSSKQVDRLYVVRLYDGFDNEWIDVSKPVSREQAEKIWNEKTDCGTNKTSYDDIDYYKIFSYEVPDNSTEKKR